MKQRPFAVKRLGQLKLSPVPDNIVERGLADSAQAALVTKWNLNPSRKRPPFLPALPQALILIIVSKFPFSIQIQPIVSYKLRTRIFGSQHACTSFVLFIHNVYCFIVILQCTYNFVNDF
jgi:hypothetical protein